MRSEHSDKHLSDNWKKLLKLAVFIILVLGIVIRIVMYLQNRDLIIDEANISRNLYERGFGRLALPLSYEQYAPPVFLWIEKLFTTLFGYSEYALRLFPLIAGIGALFVMQKILNTIIGNRWAWYPLCLMATGFIFIRYSSEIKQYICDVFIALLLLWLTLKTDIFQKKTPAFILIWICAGSIAIWASMPSVFILAGVSTYYTVLCLQQKRYDKIGLIFLIGAVWLMQFALYYFIILRPQANTDYLQRYHNDYFLFLVPKNYNEWHQDRRVLSEIMENASGVQYYLHLCSYVFFLIGIVALLRRKLAIGLLIVIPVLAVLLAASLRQYSLMPRLAMFFMPLLLICIGYGFESLMTIRSAALKGVLVIIALLSVYTNSALLAIVKHPYKDEMLTDGLTFLKNNKITGPQVYVSNGSVPAFIYYTQINPQREQWEQFKNAHYLEWNTNYDSLSEHVSTPAAFLYSAVSMADIIRDTTALGKHLRITACTEDTAHRRYAYIYTKK